MPLSENSIAVNNNNNDNNCGSHNLLYKFWQKCDYTKWLTFVCTNHYSNFSLNDPSLMYSQINV